MAGAKSIAQALRTYLAELGFVVSKGALHLNAEHDAYDFNIARPNELHVGGPGRGWGALADDTTVFVYVKPLEVVVRGPLPFKREVEDAIAKAPR